MKIVKLQIKKVRDPSRWKERDEEELAQLIERREHYARSSKPLDQEDEPRGIADARPRGIVAAMADIIFGIPALALLIAFVIWVPLPVLFVLALALAVVI